MFDLAVASILFHIISQSQDSDLANPSALVLFSPCYCNTLAGVTCAEVHFRRLMKAWACQYGWVCFASWTLLVCPRGTWWSLHCLHPQCSWCWYADDLSECEGGNMPPSFSKRWIAGGRSSLFWVYTFQFYLMLKDQPKCALYVMLSVKASLQITKMTHMPRTPHGPLAKRFSSRFFFGKSSMSSLRKPSQAQKTPAGLMSATGSFWERPTSFQEF